jgi:hypothetical protein
LHHAIPSETNLSTEECKKEEYEKDQVLEIAKILLRDIDESQGLSEIKKVITERASKDYYEKCLASFFQDSQKTVVSDLSTTPSQDVVNRKEKIDFKMAALQPTVDANIKDFNGIRLVYIQYDTNKTLAEKVQTYLQTSINKSAAPGMEKIEGIKENSIRYTKNDLELANKLKSNLETKFPNITDIKLIDLTDAGYKVPSGQLEIWLKDDNNS